MQSYNLNLTAARPQTIYPATADLFVYESGTSAGLTSIIVKPDNGNEITVKPGQWFRLTDGERASQWLVRSADGASVINGTIIIGSGEFGDANTLNKFTLDASFANNVEITNTTAKRVPVTLDTAQTLPVSLAAIRVNNTTAQRVPVTLDPAQVLNTSESIMSYTHARPITMATSAYVQIASPAENVNGIIIEQSISSQAGATLVAKAGAAPTDISQCDVLTFQQPYAGPAKRILVGAGKGIYATLSSAGGWPLYNLLTIL